MKRKIYILFILFSFSLLDLTAQDTHFSQAINAPVLLNPALTGVMSTDMRVMSNYRTQWGSLSKPYQTMSVAVDFSPLRYLFNTDDILGVGLYFMKDQAGTTELNNTQIQMTFAYSKSLNGQGNNYLSIGGQVGYANQQINTQNLTFDNQIVGNILDQSISSGENLNFMPSNYWDVSAGIGWAYTPEKSKSIYLGASIYHINEPNVSFFEDYTELLHRKYTAYFGGEFRVNYLMSLMPRGFFFKQGAATEFTYGALIKFNIENSGNRYDTSAFIIGLMNRYKDAVIPIFRYDFQKFGIGFSYDVNVSTLNPVSRGYGGMEISMFYKTQLSNKRRRGRPLSCPNF